ncbi:MAG: Hsp20/alpha crystallin family protein [Candidatus Aminicenantes bacterium]|nr:Hsp20/alpha crystallin family protein [Candidatus Aminicenantes bacterium]
MRPKPRKAQAIKKINISFKNMEEEKSVREVFPSWPSPWIPRVDISERAEELIVEIELPGIEPQDISVVVHANHIDLKGKKREDELAKGGHYIRLEREYGQFSRFIPLPCLVFPDHTVAWLEDGILTIKLKKFKRSR